MLFADETQPMPTTWIGVAAFALLPIIGFIQWWIRHRTNRQIEQLKGSVDECEEHREKDKRRSERNKAILRDVLARFATVAIVEIDDKGKVISWDSGARAIFGYTFDEMKGQPLTKILSLSKRNTIPAAIVIAAKDKRIIHNMIVEDMARKKGSAGEFKVRAKINADVNEEGLWTAIAEVQDIDIRWDAFDKDATHDELPVVRSSDSQSGEDSGGSWVKPPGV